MMMNKKKSKSKNNSQNLNLNLNSKISKKNSKMINLNLWCLRTISISPVTNNVIKWVLDTYKSQKPKEKPYKKKLNKAKTAKIKLLP